MFACFIGEVVNSLAGAEDSTYSNSMSAFAFQGFRCYGIQSDILQISASSRRVLDDSKCSTSQTSVGQTFCRLPMKGNLGSCG